MRFLSILLVAAAGAKSLEAKIAELRSLTEQNPVINMDTDMYNSFVLSGPRDYQVFVIFSADKKSCPPCVVFDELYAYTALSYKEHGMHLGSSPVFFARVEGTKNQKLLQYHEIQRYPHIAHTGPSFKRGKKPTMPFPNRAVYFVQSLNTEAAQVLHWANGHSHTSVPLFKTLAEQIQMAIFGIFILVALIATIVFGTWLVRRYNFLVKVIAHLIYFISTSGIFYSIIQKAAWWGFNRQTKEIQYISPTPRGQYFLEGIVMSTMISAAGLGMVGAARLPYVFPDSKQLNQGILMILGFSYVCFFLVMNVYQAKMGMRMEPSFFPPPNYIRGSVFNDQGITF